MAHATLNLQYACMWGPRDKFMRNSRELTTRYVSSHSIGRRYHIRVFAHSIRPYLEMRAFTHPVHEVPQ